MAKYLTCCEKQGGSLHRCTPSDNMLALKPALNHVPVKGYGILVKFKRSTWASWIAMEIRDASPTFCYFLEYKSDKLTFNTNFN